ncbi:3-deoxy-D-manno-octulosonic-acid transferase [Cyclobacterium xiamenense]|uniref:3-deoxy-D-manno-octulosonic acid transferase n=1 Tax=Cyclobacterium xiamenense TaxID=1297121 RepID=A0A1H6VM39_9BACT|nr:glycosyltransferase N-terminal domain-containing protein [Cyclobacterium xiamenense]SEJ05683.1 3-deoxy-D-manno-octulosonic-acid transferase [Cyclobacterium xiamenense]
MSMVYHLGMYLLDFFMKIGSLRSEKLKLAVEGRKELFAALTSFRKKQPSPLVWFHVASLGEYEQARPVIAAFKEKYPLWAVAVSFFSPSGYEQVRKKKQRWVDHITYIPTDTPGNAKRFVATLAPDKVIFIKYDLWANHLREVKKRKIPCFLVAASFRKEQLYFSWYGAFFRRILFRFDHIFTQNTDSLELLETIGYRQCIQSGDPRFDNVAAIRLHPTPFPKIQNTIHQPVMVLGSVWQEDMDLLIPWINQSRDRQFILAPHDINAATIRRWQQAIRLPSLTYSDFSGRENPPEWKVLVIDNIGMLSSLYQFARWAYVGGAFGKGLHNILEPLAFGIPVLFGKVRRVSKFPEAGISKQYGCGFPVQHTQELAEVLERLTEQGAYEKSCLAAKKLLQDNLGSAEKTIAHIKKLEWKEG